MTTPQERTTGITNASIKKRFGSIPAWKMLSEYIWNGLDAGASDIDVIINTCDLGGVESIEIHDNGEGIDFHNLDRNFDNWVIDDKEQHSSILSNGSGTSVFLTGITSEKS
uniref:ATP-binding protein n=1 Tax=Vibrio cholerae TaxID=666 RepID=UPI000B270D2A